MALFGKDTRSVASVPRDVMGPRIVFLLVVLALLLFGLVMVYSASFVEAINDGEDPASYMVKQVAFALVGVAVALFIWKVLPPSVLVTGNFLYIAWAVVFILILLTAAVGTEELGAQRWLVLGPVSLQPSEFMKIALVVVAARLVSELREGADRRSIVVKAAIFIALPIGLIFTTQSDLGTTMICIVGVLAVVWFGGLSKRTVIIACVVVVVLGVLAIALVGYRSSRFAYLDPWNDGEGGYGSGYAIIHSYYAFAEGGLFGVGLGNSREKFLYLPEAETDFIFSIVGEELGLIGALAVVALFVAFLVAGLRIAKSATSPFSAMLAGSCTVMIAFQAFLNIGCAIGVLPTTGKPLPFVSSGGSSLIATLIMVGLILSVSQEASAPSVHEKRRANLRLVRTARPPGERGAHPSRGR